MDDAPVIGFDRDFRLEGVHNFRDYGGYAARGGRLATGRLFRSAQHVAATPSDLARIAGLDLVAVIDLRGPAERILAPCRRPDGFSAQVIFVEQDTTGLAPHVRAAGAALTAQTARDAMLKSYAGMPFRARMLPVLARYFEALAELGGATLIHCMAGKDRTGLAVALFHHAMGVHRDDLVADYLLTNTAGRPRARIEEGARHLRQGWGGDLSDEIVDIVMGVEAAYLDAAFRAIEAEHGSVDAYLEHRLRLTPARRERLEARLVA